MSTARDVRRGSLVLGTSGLTLATFLALAGCRKASVPEGSDGAATSNGPGVTQVWLDQMAAAEDDAGVSDAGPPTLARVATHVRRQEWSEAWSDYAALPASETEPAPAHLLGAKIAVVTGHDEEAKKLTAGLEDKLPLVAPLVKEIRAAAESKVGPFDSAGRYYAARDSLADKIHAANLFEKAALPRDAVINAALVLGNPKRKADEEEAMRALRLRLETDASVKKLDAHWLFINARAKENTDAAERFLRESGAQAVLSNDDRLARAKALCAVGACAEAKVVLDVIDADSIDICRARAEVLFKGKGHLTEASFAYTQCSQRGGGHAPEDAFLAARAMLRADKDDEAITLFKRVEEKFPQTTWARDAAFLVARAHALHGRFGEAAHAFDEYEKHYRSMPGSDRPEAERYRALTHLLSKDARGARVQFEHLLGESREAILSDRYESMIALAGVTDGEELHAIARWQEISRSRPLSATAHFARARLAAQGRPTTAFDPPARGVAPPFGPPVKLPPPVDVLFVLGLLPEAEQYATSREAAVDAFGLTGTERTCALYTRLDRAKRIHRLSGQVPASLLLSAPIAGAAWGWDCTYPSPMRDLVTELETQNGLPHGLIYAIARQESGFDPEAVSPAHAVGMMQLLPETAKETATAHGLLFEEAMLTQATYSVRIAAAHLGDLYRRFGQVTTDETARVVYVAGAYNAGPEAIDRWITRLKPAPLDAWIELVPYVETRVYMLRVLGNFLRYRYRASGEDSVPLPVLAKL